MYRTFEKDLNYWFLNDDKPFMVIGLRQIGKTYLINDFCKKHFDNYLYFNFENEKWLFDLFEKTINIDEILDFLEIKFGKKIDLENTVLFFDEIQISERFINSLKYFCEYEKSIKVICAGSLLGVKINRFSSSFPVGKVTMKNMYPMNFEEFLIALGKEKYSELIKKHYEKLEKMDDSLHQDLIKFYKLYLIVGGLPASVSNFIECGMDIMLYEKNILTNIKDMYVADMKKYVSGNNETVKIEKIYNNIPLQLAKENKTFKYSEIELGAKKGKYENALGWLIYSGMVLKSKKINVPNKPLKHYVSTGMKMFISDIGVLNNISEIRYRDILLDDNFMYKGAIAENYVAEEFASKNISLYYWTSESQAEVDFIIQNDDGIIPVEVKSGDNTKSKSLNIYINQYKPIYSIRLSTKNFGMSNNIKSIPLYATFCLADEINKVNLN